MIKLCLYLVKIARKVAALLKLDCIDLIDKDIETLKERVKYENRFN
jgi:hypothetical protein